VDRLVSDGFVVRRDGNLVITDAGRHAAEKLYAARCEALEHLLDSWEPEKYPDLEAALRNLARASVGGKSDPRTLR
jgi:DNA-binding MarR family transcriptional regulator